VTLCPEPEEALPPPSAELYLVGNLILALARRAKPAKRVAVAEALVDDMIAGLEAQLSLTKIARIRGPREDAAVARKARQAIAWLTAVRPMMRTLVK